MTSYANPLGADQVLTKSFNINTKASQVIVPGLTRAALTSISLDASSWVEATAALSGRAVLNVQNISGNTNVVLWGYINSGSTGWNIVDGGFRSVVISSGQKVYLKMKSGSGSVVVEELGA